MSDPCEIVESYATATNSFPALDTIVRVVSGASTNNALFLGSTLAVLSSAGASTSQAFDSAFALITDTAQTLGTALISAAVAGTFTSAAHGTDSVSVEQTQVVITQAAAAGVALSLDTPIFLWDTAHASNTLFVDNTASVTLTENAAAVSTVLTGQQELATSTATSTNTLWAHRLVNTLVENTAAATSDVDVATTPAVFLLLSTAYAVSDTVAQLTAQNIVVSEADALSDTLFKDAARIAWVMNTETTAVSWYNNFDFNSIAQTANKTFAADINGITVIEGDTDYGSNIPAEVISGYMDFGIPQTKRVDAMYFGFGRASSNLQITVEVFDSGHPLQTYTMVPRGTVLRANRIMLGKGLYGRYWRMAIKNDLGTPFEINNATIDIAVSQRRI